jgi:hypothetical protein
VPGLIKLFDGYNGINETIRARFDVIGHGAVLRGQALARDVSEKTRERLAGYASALERRGNAGRANARRMFVDMITRNGGVAELRSQ